VNDDVDLDVSWLVPADLAAVDALARLQLAAARCGALDRSARRRRAAR